MSILVRDIAIAQDQGAIVAQCTPIGPGAIALLRISGSNACIVAERIIQLASGEYLTMLPTHTIHYGWVVDVDRTRIDNVLVLLMRGPKTFTGQDTVEITCHNNQFIIEQILEVAIAAGARLAHNGEFSYRAVLNNKIDVIQAESINELIHANTQMGLKLALHQVQGSLSCWISDIEKRLLKVVTYCEASFEFIDEEMGFDQEIKKFITSVLASIENIKSTYNQQQHIRQGIRVAIIGSVNVGKSSLFNALLNQNRSIVTNIAGTTRDVVETGLYRGGHYWTLADTAGLRQTDDIIEQEGIERSREQAELADIILLVFDASRELTASEKEIYSELSSTHKNKIIRVYNKADLINSLSTHHQESTMYLISTKTQYGINVLQVALEEYIVKLFKTIESPFLLNKRHYNVLLSLEKELQYVQAYCIDAHSEQQLRYELISYHIVEALAYVGELTGKSISEQGMDAIFKEFCVGK